MGRFLRGLSRRLEELLSAVKWAHFLLLWMDRLTFGTAPEPCHSVRVGDQQEGNAGSKPVNCVLKWRLMDLFSVHRAAVWSWRSVAVCSPFVPQFLRCALGDDFLLFLKDLQDLYRDVECVCPAPSAPAHEWWVRAVGPLGAPRLLGCTGVVLALNGGTSLLSLWICLSCKINVAIRFSICFKMEES